MLGVATTSTFIKETAREAGFELAGVASVRQFPEFQHFEQWIASGHAGEMKYMEARDDKGKLRRASLTETMPWARTVIVCGINYNTTEPKSLEATDAGRGWISRYAWGQQDYHDAVLRRLQSVDSRLREHFSNVDLQTRCYVDTGPLVERIYAKYAGVGWVGKNTCLINQKIGSWFFLGVILTSLDLEPDMAAPDRCGSCTRCIDACPTDALIGPFQLDANRCISYLTIEKRGSIPDNLRHGIGRHVFGCDICQDVCPWNRKASVTVLSEFQPRKGLVNPALEWLAELTEEEFRDRFRGSAIKRAKRGGLRRNALIAMGNSGETGFLPIVDRMMTDEDTVVAEAAHWAKERLSQPQSE